ncbi:hypothetical protein HK099_005320 [Clydaea vesicula]|uniref:Uncharacterized protein n=1 Tax=Clydaea vesicula TaxID=447962 RepID=A0AAD5U2M6_9FUNG|nr:hypothetical protein HK099_005320 [Clydaea vesicula]
MLTLTLNHALYYKYSTLNPQQFSVKHYLFHPKLILNKVVTLFWCVKRVKPKKISVLQMSNLNFPAYGLRTPLTKGFPTNGKKIILRVLLISIAGKARQTTAPKRNDNRNSAAPNTRVEDERSPQNDQMDQRQNRQNVHAQSHNGPSAMDLSSQTAPLNDSIKNLKYKYIELQETHKKESKKLEEQLAQLKTEFNFQTITLQNVEKERQELIEANKQIKEHNTAEKDKIYGEALSFRKKLQTSQSDLSRMELQYQRINTERQKFQTENGSLKEESQIEDVHATYSTFDLDAHKARIGELQLVIKELRSQVQIAETRQQQEEHLRMRAMEDCSELVRANVGLKTELEDVQRRLRKVLIDEFEQREEKLRHKQEKIKDVEIAREEVSRLKDDLTMLKISTDAKDNKIYELLSKNKSVEALDTQRVLEDRIIDLENRIRIGEGEVIQLGQDKSLLIDDVAELRNSTEINSNKVKTLVREKQELQVELAKYQREMSARKEFSSMLQNLEASGENYLGLMRNMKCFIKGDTEIDNQNTESSNR